MGTDRTARCHHCGTDWTPPPKAGFPPKFCPAPECQEAFRLYRNAQVRLARQTRERKQRDEAERIELTRQIMAQELDAIMLQAETRTRTASREELGGQVRSLALATGVDSTYAALIRVAATSLAWATRIRPDSGIKLVEEPDQDYGKLMVA